MIGFNMEQNPQLFLNLEKRCATQGQIITIVSSEKEISDETKILKQFSCFYKSLYE